jgi:hypothetical protein
MPGMNEITVEIIAAEPNIRGIQVRGRKLVIVAKLTTTSKHCGQFEVALNAEVA